MVNNKLLFPTVIFFILIGVLGSLGYNLYLAQKRISSKINDSSQKVKANVCRTGEIATLSGCPTLVPRTYQGEVVNIKIRSQNSGFLEILDNGRTFEINVDDSETRIFDDNSQPINLSSIKNGFIVRVTQLTNISKMSDVAITASEIRVVERR